MSNLTTGNKRGPNKIGAAVKSNVMAVFDRIGGRDKMVAWANENLTEFYRLYARLIPTESSTEITFRDVTELSHSELLVIASGRGERDISEGSGSAEPNGIH
jgi:hypothetical protein